MASPIVSANILPFILGFWLLIIGVYIISVSLRIKDHPKSGWGWVLTDGILSIIFAILILLLPSVGVVTIVILIGLALLINGIADIYLAYRLKSIKKRFE